MIDAEFELNACLGFFGDGAGFLVQGGTTTVINAVFNGNTARTGAAFMSRNVTAVGGATVNVTNAVIAGNQIAEDSGGTIDLNEETAATLAHVTLSGNDGFSTLRFGANSNVALHNVIVWDNDFEESPILVQQSGGTVDVDHAIIEGGFEGGEAVFSDAPLFFAAPDDGPDDRWGTDDDDYGDLRLQPGSPAVALGDLDLVPQDQFDLDDDGVTTELLPFDLDGERRVQDGAVELGAYEGVGTPISTEPDALVAADLALSASRPNPTRGLATLALTVASAEPVQVAVYDLLGREVLRLHDGPLAVGTHPLAMDASALAAGLYVVRAASASGTATRRVTVVR